MCWVFYGKNISNNLDWTNLEFIVKSFINVYWVFEILLISNRVDNTPMKLELFDIYFLLLDVCLFCLFDGV